MSKTFRGEVEHRLQRYLETRTPDQQGYIQVPARDLRAAVHVIVVLKDFRQDVIKKATKTMGGPADVPKAGA